jgi:DNA-binding transcriptional regulator PaaX
MRDVAAIVGVTERAIQRIVRELEEAGYLQREREGRRNRYLLREKMPLRHPLERHCAVSTLLEIVRGG